MNRALRITFDAPLNPIVTIEVLSDGTVVLTGATSSLITVC
jgi:hypothetical protein